MQTRVDESGWLDDVWAEGGAVLEARMLSDTIDMNCQGL